MKILQVNDVANVGTLLVRAQNEAGHQAELIKFCIPFVRANRYIKILTFPLRMFYLLKKNIEIISKNADVVHIHYANFGWLGILGWYKYYLHCHGTDVRVGLFHPLKKLYITRALKNAEKVFYSTPDLEALVCSVRKDAIFIPNPILIPDIKKKIFSKNLKKVLLFSELNDELKGTKIAIELLNQLRKIEKIETHALIYGKDYTKYRDLEWIVFHEKIKRENLYSFISNFDLIVGQFSFGSLGVAEFEAMACGIPVISFFNFKKTYPLPPELPDTKNIETLVEFAGRILNSLEESGKKNRYWVERNHEYRHIGQMVLTEYGI